MGTKPIDENEMPVVFPRLEAQDKNNSGGFDPEEINALPDSEAVCVFAYTHEGSDHTSAAPPQQVSYDHAVNVLTQVAPEKRSAILRGLSSYCNIFSNSHGNEFLDRLAQKGLETLVDDLARDYTSGDSNGLACHLLLRSMEPTRRSEIMSLLEQRYPDYAALVEKWDEPIPQKLDYSIVINNFGSKQTCTFNFPALPLPTDQQILDELETALQDILNRASDYANPEFSSNDFFHGHVVQSNTNFGFLFHTKEWVQIPDPPSKRNIIFWFSADGTYSQAPQSGVTVSPLDICAMDRKEIVFSRSQDDLKHLLLQNSEYNFDSLTLSQNGQEFTLWVAISKET